MKSLIYSIIAMSVFLIGCNEKSKDVRYNALNKELNDYYGLTADKTIKQIFIINEGGCPNCVTSFSNFVLNNIDKYKDSTLILINSKGLSVDIDRFEALGLNNILISGKHQNENSTIPNLGVIYINPNKQSIDTIVSVDAMGFENQINYIADRN